MFFEFLVVLILLRFRIWLKSLLEVGVLIGKGRLLLVMLVVWLMNVDRGRKMFKVFLIFF